MPPVCAFTRVITSSVHDLLTEQINPFNVNALLISIALHPQCPKQGLEMEALVLHRVGFLEYFCPKQISNPRRHPYTQTWVKYLR